MPESLAAEAAAARREGVSESALVCEAVEMFLSADEVAQPSSALDLVGDLAGSFEGPEDLSTNTRHMEGFGE